MGDDQKRKPLPGKLARRIVHPCEVCLKDQDRDVLWAAEAAAAAAPRTEGNKKEKKKNRNWGLQFWLGLVRLFFLSVYLFGFLSPK